MAKNTSSSKSAKPTLKDRFKKMIKNPAVIGIIAMLTSYVVGFKHGQSSTPNYFDQLQDQIGDITTATIKGTKGEMRYYVGEKASNAILKDKNGLTTMMGWDDTGKVVLESSNGVKMVTNGSGEWEAVDSLSDEEQALVGTMPVPQQIGVNRSGIEK